MIIVLKGFKIIQKIIQNKMLYKMKLEGLRNHKLFLKIAT